MDRHWWVCDIPSSTLAPLHLLRKTLALFTDVSKPHQKFCGAAVWVGCEAWRSPSAHVSTGLSCALRGVQATLRSRADRKASGICPERTAGDRRRRKCRLFLSPLRAVGGRKRQSNCDRAGGSYLPSPALGAQAQG